MSEQPRFTQKLATELGCSEERAAQLHETFINDETTRAIIKIRANHLHEEKGRAYDSCKPEETPKIQGFRDGIQKTLAAIFSK